MRADRSRARGAAALVLSLAMLLTGCATMPSEGEVTKVEISRRAEHESRVRVYGVSPQKGQRPQDIVRGFLEATTSDEPRFTTAKEYLTEEAAKDWDPFARTTVLEGGPTTGPARADGADGRRDGSGAGTGALDGGDGTDGAPAPTGYTVDVSGTRTAELDSLHTYDSQGGEFSRAFHLTKVKGKGWRIDQLPDGLILGESDFERIYRSVNTFYFADLGSDSASVSAGRNPLVAHPVYVRSRIEPVAETIRALLDGPTTWLDPVVTTAFPEGTRLAHSGSAAMDDSGAVRVRLNGRGADVGDLRCERMAAQVLHSVQSQVSSDIESVELNGPRGHRVCRFVPRDPGLYGPGRLGGRARQPYIIDADGRVAYVEQGSREAKTVTGPLGSGVVPFRSVGVSRAERLAAAVSEDGRSLYVASLSPGEKPLVPVLTSNAVRPEDGLSAPSWDGLGDLWVADRDPSNPRLLRFRGGQGEPEEVAVPGLGSSERIESLRISSDGVRIALRLRGPDGDSALKLGRVERDGTRDDPSVSVAALAPVAPQLEDVVAVSWSGHSELAVVGRESRGVQQLQYVGTDGSTTHQPPLPGINDVHGVAASEREGTALLAESQYGIVRLPVNDPDWETVVEGGSAPVYPG